MFVRNTILEFTLINKNMMKIVSLQLAHIPNGGKLFLNIRTALSTSLISSRKFRIIKSVNIILEILKNLITKI